MSGLDGQVMLASVLDPLAFQKQTGEPVLAVPGSEV
jgi:hypothetical protein